MLMEGTDFFRSAHLIEESNMSFSVNRFTDLMRRLDLYFLGIRSICVFSNTQGGITVG